MALGITSLQVQSFTCCHTAGAHVRGDAMDISMINGETVRRMGSSRSDLLGEFETLLTGDAPRGAQILGPNGFGYNIGRNGPIAQNMSVTDRNTGVSLYEEHAGHVHYSWGPK